MTREESLAILVKRRANPPKKIRNADLHAGSPMYFYCVSCDWLADEKPEGFLTPIKKLCDHCQKMKDCGWLE